MPAFHLDDETLSDIRGVECPAPFGDHGVKQDLEQQVSELLSKFPVVAGANGIVDFVRFFDEIWTQRLVGLRRVPLATGA
jgi:hypothetical protein